MQTHVWRLCDRCQILDLINFQNNLTWPNATFLKSVQILGWNTVKLLIGVKIPPPFTLYWKTSHWYGLHQVYLSISLVRWHKCQSVFSPYGTLAHARYAGRFDCLVSILMEMDNGRGRCSSPEIWGSKPNPQRNWKLENACYKTKLISVQNTEFIPSSCQIHLVLGKHVRYFAQIWICIPRWPRFMASIQ